MSAKEKNVQNEILGFVSEKIRTPLSKMEDSIWEGMEEIRLRAYKPLMIHDYNGDHMVRPDGSLSRRIQESQIIEQTEISRTLELMCEKSIYAYIDEIKNGYITLRGGHRIGIAGKVIMEGDKIKNIKDISGLNIRISRAVEGCAKKLMDYILTEKNDIYNILILSPPQCGKTTLLRDIARLLGDGLPDKGFHGVKVGIVDERSEIGSSYKGIPQHSVGMRTDVLDGCPKTLGMDMMLRSMSPKVIITDEIGNPGDRDAVFRVLNAGIKIITSAHGFNISQLKARAEVLGLLERKVFDRFVVLSNAGGPGTVEEIINGSNMEVIYSNDT